MPLWALAIAAVPFAWLVPNHYYPWPSAWQDGPALLLTGLALVGLARPAWLPRIPGLWTAAIGVAALSVTLQWVAGRIVFGGDALMVLVYLAAFAGALVLGRAAVESSPGARNSPLDLVAAAITAAAIASVAIALVQWTGAFSMGIYAADLPRGARPFANLAQPNHLCTAAFLGLCSVAILRETGSLGRVGFWIGATFLTLGMVMSGSRTGWLQMAVLMLLALALQHRVVARVRPRDLFVLGAAYVGATALWPAVNDVLLLSGGRGLVEQIDGSGRWPVARVLLDAVTREPLWGYGWQQVTHAQQAVALDHPSVMRHFEHSHNLLLDLVLWAGIPVGALIALLGGAALFRQARATVDARAMWLLAGPLGLITHAMLELPHEYAYFLIPAGLMVGAAHAITRPQDGLACQLLPLRAAAAAGVCLIGAIAFEYLQAEQNHRMLRLESAHIGTEGIETPAVELHLLTQLGAFLRFARTEAHPGMSPQELAWMKQVSMRFAYPPSMLRYALAAGLNGKADEAQLTLGRMCRMQLPARCDEAREAWQTMQERYPSLPSISLP